MVPSVAQIMATVDNGSVALDPNDGLRVLDTFQHKSLDSYAVVMSEQNRALVCCTDGTVILLQLKDNHWQLIGEAQPKRNAAPVLAHPALADGKLYLRGDRTVYCYRLSE